MSNLLGLNLVSGAPTDTGAVSTLDQLMAAGLASLGLVTNPSSVLTRPADALAYAQNDLIATNTTAASVAVPSFAAARAAAGSFTMLRARLYSSVTSGWDQVALRVRFWTGAPTYTNGDNGAYAVATGATKFLGYMDITLNQFADGAAGNGIPASGASLLVALASGTSVFWDLQYIGSAALTPVSAQTFTLVPEIQQLS